jgi:hypothetical protein
MKCLRWAFAIPLLSSFASAELISVCTRSVPVKNQLVASLGKPCDAITSEDLLSIRTLQLNDRKSTQLKISDFAGLGSLSVLIMNLPLTSVPEGIFSGLANVENISMWMTRLTLIPPKLYRGLPKLVRVIISRETTAKTAIPLAGDLLVDQPNLKFLDLAGFGLSGLPDGFFKNNNQLQ